MLKISYDWLTFIGYSLTILQKGYLFTIFAENVLFNWNEYEENAFNFLKERLLVSPVFLALDPEKKIAVIRDTYKVSLGAVEKISVTALIQ